jgi:hypothetical protein
MDQQSAKKILDGHLGRPNDGCFRLQSDEVGVIVVGADGQRKLSNSDMGGSIDFTDEDNFIFRPDAGQDNETESIAWSEIADVQFDRPKEPPRFFLDNGIDPVD